MASFNELLEKPRTARGYSSFGEFLFKGENSEGPPLDQPPPTQFDYSDRRDATGPRPGNSYDVAGTRKGDWSRARQECIVECESRLGSGEWMFSNCVRDCMVRKGHNPYAYWG